MQLTDWPPDHTQALRDFHAKGMSYGEIAKEINARFGTGYTRNATLGRGKRIGLVSPARPQPQRSPRPRRAEPAATSERKGPETERAGAFPQPPERRSQPVLLRCVGVSPRLIGFDELEPGDCRYPYGGDKDGEPITFCGHPRRPGSSYCTPHFDLTRNPELTERLAGPVVLRLVAAA